jgi:hypothetical protein
MPLPPKPVEKRINRVTKSVGRVRSPGTPPRMPARLCRAAQNAWHAYWGDDVSGITRPSDSTVVLRWVTNLDRMHRLLGEADKCPIVAGSKGQPQTNPIYRLALRLEDSIREDERQLGIGGLNRLRLGVLVAEGQKTLTELNAQADDSDTEDPRLILLQPEDSEDGTAS